MKAKHLPLTLLLTLLAVGCAQIRDKIDKEEDTVEPPPQETGESEELVIRLRDDQIIPSIPVKSCHFSEQQPNPFCLEVRTELRGKKGIWLNVYSEPSGDKVQGWSLWLLNLDSTPLAVKELPVSFITGPTGDPNIGEYALATWDIPCGRSAIEAYQGTTASSGAIFFERECPVQNQ